MPQQRDDRLLVFDPSSADDQTESTTSSNHGAHPLLEKNTTKAENEEAKPPDGAHHLEKKTPPQTRHRLGASWINPLGSMKKTGEDVGAETKPETKVRLDKEESHSNDDDDDDEAVSDFVASLEAKKPSRHRRGASLMSALGILKSDAAAGAAAPKPKVDQEEESFSNDEAITDDVFLETKKPPHIPTSPWRLLDQSAGKHEERCYRNENGTEG